MATARRSSTARKAAPATASRRGRSAEDEDEDEEEDTGRVERRRDRAAAAKKSTTRSRRDEEPEDDEEEDDDEDAYDEDDYDDEAEDEDEDDDEEEEERRPRKSTASSRPAKSTAKKASAGRRPAASKRTSRRDDDDAPVRAGVRAGWSGFDQVKSLFSQFPDRMYLSDDAELILFLDNEPFAEYRQHWVPNPKGKGNRPYNCIEKNCPLCEIAVDASANVAFNVVHMSTGGEPVRKVLHLNITATNALQDAAKNDRAAKGAIDRTYWSIWKSGKSGKRGQGQTVPHFTVVRERDLEEDWEEITPLSEEEVEDFKEKAYTADDIKMPTRKELREIADSIMEDDDEEEDDED